MLKALLVIAGRRAVGVVPTLLLLSILVFLVLRALPVDPLAMLLPPNATAADAAALRSALGLDLSLPQQYGIWLQQALAGDLGRSIAFHEPVASLIGKALPATVELSAAGLALAVLISVLGGMLAYAVHGKAAGVLLDVVVVSMLSIPSFLWAISLMLLFGVLVPLLPVAGRLDSSTVASAVSGLLLIDFLLAGDLAGWVDALRHLLLPALALALGFSPPVIRVLRSSLIEAEGEPYVLIARQRGLSRSRVLVAHMLRNAILPALTLIGAQFGYLFGGTLLVETIFSFPGIGNLMVQAVRNFDLPLIQGIALLFCILILVINTIVDLLAVMLNPKLRRAA